MESTDLSALRQTTSILCLRLSELLLIPTCTRITPRWGTSFSRLPRFRERCAHSIGLPARLWTASPNIQSVRTGHRRTWDYVGKDGDIVYEIGDPPDPIGGPSGAAATLYGLRLYAQNLKKNFIRSCETELRDIISYITDNSNNTPRSSMEFVHNHTNRQPLRTLLDRELPNGRARRLSETTEEDTDGEV